MVSNQFAHYYHAGRADVKFRIYPHFLCAEKQVGQQVKDLILDLHKFGF